MPVFNKLSKMAHNETLRSSEKKKLLAAKLKEETSSDDSEHEDNNNNNNSEDDNNNNSDDDNNNNIPEVTLENCIETHKYNNNNDDEENDDENDENENNNNNNNNPQEINLSIKEPAQWVERMSITATRPLPTDLSPDDDPKREEVFLQHSLLSVLRGLSLLTKAGVPFARPDDYYTEMYKSDVHMDKIRSAIIESKQKVQDRTHRRAMKDQRKFGKEVQAEALRQKSKHKKELSDKLADWRRKRRGNEDPRSKLDDIINEAGGNNNNNKYNKNNKNGKGAARKGSVRGSAGKKSLKPGGGNRPGKNRRNRK